ncbi:MAG: 2OG-Fe dioxygenase family protein [Acidobacteria bacterium]|nr:2OG-Fe dioxygenase family protein [Acidobacteriota bacterium]
MMAIEAVEHEIATRGFALLPAREVRALLEASGPLDDIERFAASWDGLALDTYMADGGRYRRRRHAAFAVVDGRITRKPHQPHYQTVEYNPLHGGIARWFEPILPEIGSGAALQTILRFCARLFGDLAKDAREWHVEAHQFRIEARPGEQGRPTPEGMHRDGVDYVLVLLIHRQNIVSGTTTIHDLEQRPLGSFTLAYPFDAAIVEDARVYHGVTAVSPLDPAAPAFRDVLVVTFRKI